MFTVKCPECQHDMLYKPVSSAVVGKKKLCVYCGTSFSVHPNIKNSRIVCPGKRIEFNTPIF